MGVLFDEGIGVLHGDGQAHLRHHRQIDEIIADISNLFGGQAESRQQTVKRRQLVVDAEIGVADAQIAQAGADAAK